MCGLFGWYLKPGEFTLDEKGRMAQMLVSRTNLRGGDSWGVACPVNKRYEIYKGLGELHKQTVMSSISTFDIVYGHTRKATSGVISVRNAHPFHVNHIVGAHNGIISNSDALNKKHNRSCTVDSQHIFYQLSERKPLDELFGWGAFWWFTRAAPTKIHLFKSFAYSMDVYGIGEHGKSVVGLVFASDGRDIEAALRLTGRAFFPYKFKEGLEYLIESWSSLQYTNNKMHFGREYAQTHVPQCGFSYNRPAFTHMTRTQRMLAFKDVTSICNRCNQAYVFLYDRLCGDCLEREMSRPVSTPDA